MEATVDPPSKGSRLDADHPLNGVLIPCRFTLVCLAHLDRTEDARDWLKRVLDLYPGLTIAAWKASFAATAAYSPQLLALYVDGMRKAGLPQY
jgi:hypothetical protein